MHKEQIELKKYVETSTLTMLECIQVLRTDLLAGNVQDRNEPTHEKGDLRF